MLVQLMMVLASPHRVQIVETMQAHLGAAPALSVRLGVHVKKHSAIMFRASNLCIMSVLTKRSRVLQLRAVKKLQMNS